MTDNKCGASSGLLSIFICWLREAAPSQLVAAAAELQIFSTKMRSRKQGRVENLGYQEVYNNTELQSEVSQTSLLEIAILRRIYHQDDDEEKEGEEEEEEEEDELEHKDHYLLSDGKTYILILCLIVLCGGIVVSNIFFPNRDRDKKNNNSEGK